MLPENVQQIKEIMLKDYLSSQLLYVEFTTYVENKIKNILMENEIKYQSLSSRVKNYDSLEKKLTEKIINGVHKDIKKLNDLSGVRVIFYDEKELTRFNNIVYDEFDIKSYRPPKDIMEYDGINITVSLKKNFNRFKNLLCEIQLTTLLSHAMNEFGHNIIYKDIDELHSKDYKEYERIKSTFESARKEVLSIMASLEFINVRVSSIKNGAKNIELLLEKNFSKKLDKVKSLTEIEEIICKMVEVLPLINDDKEKYKKIYDSGIIYSIVKKFSELPIETAKLLNYDTYEYKYEKMLDFLQSYKYLWIEDFKKIISVLYRISIHNDIVGKFDKFIENLIISDKADSKRGYAYFNIHEAAYTLIFDKEIDEYIRIKLSEYFCNLNYNYYEEVDMNKVSFVNSKINPNDNYKNKIYMVINELLNLFFHHYSKTALHSLININHDLERNNDIFDNNPIDDFFYDNYDSIDVYSKNKLYQSICMWDFTKLKQSKFYKKFKSDKIQKLYAMVFNFIIDDIPNSKFDEQEEYRTNYLNDYINNFKKNNVKDIITILNAVDNEDVINYYYNAGRFLINIGQIEKYGKEIIENKWNEYVLLGVINQDKKYKITIEDETRASKIIQAMIITGNINNKMIKSLINYAEKNKKIEIEILKLIANNIDLVCNNEYKDYMLNKIKKYNNIPEGIMGDILQSPHTERKIIEEYSYDEINIILENFRYSEFNRLNEFFLKGLFEKYPSDLRMLIKQKVDDEPNSNLNNSYGYINLTKCNNYNEERYNNLSLCIELLSYNNYYKISNYIHYLIGEYNDELGEDILKYLEYNNNYNNYINVVNLCRLLDVSIPCWKIYEFIISMIDPEDKLIDEIDCLLFNTGVVSGEYGIANAFHEKYLFFKELKPRKKKVKEFVNKEIERFEILYQSEKNRIDKDKIKEEIKYKLENKKNNDELIDCT